MDSTIIFITVISIVVLITVFSCQDCKTLPNNTFEKMENFSDCDTNPYRPRPKIYPDYKLKQEKRTCIKYGEDEDINFRISNPLVPRITQQPGEKTSWRTFWREKFMPGTVPQDNNFEGTQIRNYLNSMQYFLN